MSIKWNNAKKDVETEVVTFAGLAQGETFRFLNGFNLDVIRIKTDDSDSVVIRGDKGSCSAGFSQFHTYKASEQLFVQRVDIEAKEVL